MSSFYNNGYQETIQKGLSAVRAFRSGFSAGTGNREAQIEQLKRELDSAEAVVIGAGAGHNWWCVLYPSLCLPEGAEGGMRFHSVILDWLRGLLGGGR